jgi:hypothetical protein
LTILPQLSISLAKKRAVSAVFPCIGWRPKRRRRSYTTASLRTSLIVPFSFSTTALSV